MAHLVYKKPLQAKETREKFKGDLKDLQTARNLGLLDNTTYKAAKKSLVEEPELAPIPLEQIRSNVDLTVSSRPPTARTKRSESTSSGSSGSASTYGLRRSATTAELSTKYKTRKGSIFDRNNVGRLVYKPHAQSEEDRAYLKEEFKLKKDADGLRLVDNREDVDVYGGLQTISKNNESFQHGGIFRSSTTTTSSSSSHKSGSGQKNFNFFRKRSKTGGSPMLQPTSPMIQPISPMLQPASSPPFSAQDTSWLENTVPNPIPPLSPMEPRRNPFSGSFYTAALAASVRSGKTQKDEEPRTLADFFLIGPSSNNRRAELANRRHTRRHSTSSQERHSFSGSSRQSITSEKRYKDDFVFPFSAARNIQDPHYGVHKRSLDIYPPEEMKSTACATPASTLLLDLFFSMLDEFSNTPKLFSFAKYDEIKGSCANSMIEKPEAVMDEETILLRSILEKRAWFLMSLMWLSFGRLLFSPGHHLLNLGGVVEEMRILDLDGTAVGDWAWLCAREYPGAYIYNLDPAAASSIQPENVRRVEIDKLTSLAALPSNSFDVISSRMLPAFVEKSEWHPILKECYRVLKRDGYIELTIVDPILNNMGPLTKQWILENVLQNSPRTFDIRPSKTVLPCLDDTGFTDVKKCWVWVPATSIGDELSTVTSRVGRYLFDELYGKQAEDTHLTKSSIGVAVGPKSESVGAPFGLLPHRELGMWRDEDILAECNAENTVFRWLKCHARKP
ncbi:hypothetical protein RUND412_000636 [Rhizina undulata]